MRYDGTIVQTRRGAIGWACLLVAILAMPVVQLFDTSEPMRALRSLSFIVVALVPLFLTIRCVRFLAERERLHDEPTPEMTFIFRIAVGVSTATGGLLLSLLSMLTN